VAKKAASFAALGGLVFSTDAGRHCPECSKPVDACICKQTVIPAGDGIARVRRESKGRGGKTVTTITGVPLAEDALKELATTLKKRCGTGGALKDGVIEIQGDHVELLLAELIKHGFKAKKSGCPCLSGASRSITLPKVAISLCPPKRIAGGQKSRILRRPGRSGIFHRRRSSLPGMQ